MDRRIALKNLVLGLGYTVATPTLFSILSSCNEKTETWKPMFFNDSQKHMVEHLVDIILPTSESPGGLDVNVPQFMDLMYKEFEGGWEKSIFKKGSSEFQKRFENKYDKKVLTGVKEEFEELFKFFFVLSDDNTQKVMNKQRLNEKDVLKADQPDYYLYKFLLSVKNYSLLGYFTSQKVGEEVLSYDPVPGEYNGCVPVEEIGNAWSLK